jgi:hypothetical protein
MAIAASVPSVAKPEKKNSVSKSPDSLTHPVLSNYGIIQQNAKCFDDPPGCVQVNLCEMAQCSQIAM